MKKIVKKRGNQELTIYTIEFYGIIKKIKIKTGLGKLCMEFVINTIEMAYFLK